MSEAAVALENQPIETPMDDNKAAKVVVLKNNNNSNVLRGVFCRDLAAVGSLIARTGLSQPVPV